MESWLQLIAALGGGTTIGVLVTQYVARRRDSETHEVDEEAKASHNFKELTDVLLATLKHDADAHERALEAERKERARAIAANNAEWGRRLERAEADCLEQMNRLRQALEEQFNERLKEIEGGANGNGSGAAT